MRFKDFVQLDEVGTSTSCIAGFKRISIPLTRRIFPPEIGWIDPEEEPSGKKKNPYRVPQIKEGVVGDTVKGFGGLTGAANTGQHNTMLGKAGQMASDVSGLSMFTKALGAMADQFSPGWRERDKAIKDQWAKEAEQAKKKQAQQPQNPQQQQVQQQVNQNVDQFEDDTAKMIDKMLSDPNLDPETKKALQQMKANTQQLGKSMKGNAVANAIDTTGNALSNIIGRGGSLSASTSTT